MFEFDEEALDDGFQSARDKESEYYGQDLADNFDKIPSTVLDDAKEELRVVPGSTDFATLSLKMENVTNDGRIKKWVSMEGTCFLKVLIRLCGSRHGPRLPRHFIPV